MRRDLGDRSSAADPEDHSCSSSHPSATLAVVPLPFPFSTDSSPSAAADHPADFQASPIDCLAVQNVKEILAVAVEDPSSVFGGFVEEYRSCHSSQELEGSAAYADLVTASEGPYWKSEEKDQVLQLRGVRDQPWESRQIGRGRLVVETEGHRAFHWQGDLALAHVVVRELAACRVGLTVVGFVLRGHRWSSYEAAAAVEGARDVAGVEAGVAEDRVGDHWGAGLAVVGVAAGVVGVVREARFHSVVASGVSC